jgi:hypothetical protein
MEQAAAQCGWAPACVAPVRGSARLLTGENHQVAKLFELDRAGLKERADVKRRRSGEPETPRQLMIAADRLVDLSGLHILGDFP